MESSKIRNCGPVDIEKPEDQKEEIVFNCSSCGMKERCHYFGKKPPFLRKRIIFSENAYVAKDPFSPFGEGLFLLLGAHCSRCNKVVCQSQNCSIYYKERFCKDCAQKNCSKFPPQIQRIIKKADDT